MSPTSVTETTTVVSGATISGELPVTGTARTLGVVAVVLLVAGVAIAAKTRDRPSE